MTGNHIARSLLLAAGLLFAGCGGADIADSENGPSLATREDRIVCDGTFIWRKFYYSDASYSVVVGERSCDCYGSLNWGQTSAFRRDENGTCDP